MVNWVLWETLLHVLVNGVHMMPHHLELFLPQVHVHHVLVHLEALGLWQLNEAIDGRLLRVHLEAGCTKQRDHVCVIYGHQRLDGDSGLGRGLPVPLAEELEPLAETLE